MASLPETPHRPSEPSVRSRQPLPRRWFRPALPTDPIVEASVAVADVTRRDRAYRRALAAADVGAVVAAVLAISVVTQALPKATAWLLLPFVVLAAKIYGLYDRDELLVNKTTIDEAPQLFQVATLLAFAMSLVDDRVLSTSLSSGDVVVLWLCLIGTLLLGRRAVRTLMKRVVATERCVFVGGSASYDRLALKLEVAANAELVGRMAPQPNRTNHRAHGDALRDLLDRTHAHRVVIDPQALPDQEMLELVRTAKGLGVRVSLLPSVHDVVGSEVVFDNVAGMTLLGVRTFGLTRSSRLIKRSFDLLGGTVLLVLASPLMALIALAIKLDSRGPVLFQQVRVGRGGHRFKICKFRTMVPDAEARKSELQSLNEADGLFKIAEDPRITRVGRILRKTSLDELAQLFNVVRGDMSLVGPRPLIVDEDAKIKGTDRGRLQLTPGMTGHWQIAGSARVPMHEMVKIDYLYVAGWSLWADVKILLRTVPYVLARRGQ